LSLFTTYFQKKHIPKSLQTFDSDGNSVELGENVSTQNSISYDKSSHLIPLFLTVCVWSALFFYLWSVIVPVRTNTTFQLTTLDNIKNASIIAFWVCYAVYFINCCVSGSARYLCNIHTTESAYDYVKRIKLVAPNIWFSIQCYHYETHVRTEYYTDSNGNRQSREVSETVRVNTYYGTETFRYSEWSDISGEFGHIEKYDITKVTFSKTYAFGDTYSSQMYTTQRSAFIESNRHRDTHYDESEHYDISGYKPKLLSLTDVTKKPFCLNIGWYLLLSLVGLSWFYRIWMERVCVKTAFTFTKRVLVR